MLRPTKTSVRTVDKILLLLSNLPAEAAPSLAPDVRTIAIIYVRGVYEISTGVVSSVLLDWYSKVIMHHHV
jgi:hypothetical protein